MSTILNVDDLDVGGFYTVYGVKENEGPCPIGGLAWELKAIQFPFIVCKLVAQPNHPPITLDVRFLDFMKVDEAFVKAQIGDNPIQTMGLPPNHPLAVLFGQR